METNQTKRNHLDSADAPCSLEDANVEITALAPADPDGNPKQTIIYVDEMIVGDDPTYWCEGCAITFENWEALRAHLPGKEQAEQTGGNNV